MPILWGQVEPVTRLKQVWVYAIAVISLGLYIWLAFRYPLSPGLVDPRASWATQVTPTVLNAVIHLGIYLALILLYLIALYTLTPTHGKVKLLSGHLNLFIVAVWLVCSGALMFVSPSGESHDIFDYLFRGRMMVEYQANPLAEIPDSFDISTPYSRYLAWRYHVDTYGPVWEGTSAVVAKSVHQVSAWLGWWDESAPVCPKSAESCRLLIVYITGYRLLAVLLTGISGWLIAKIVGRTQPDYVPMSIVAWLWCPLTMVSTAVGAHNDAVMLVFVLLGWWLLQKERLYWSLMALILAVHVKLTALIWFPVFFIYVYWRYGRRRSLQVFLMGSASGVVISWLLYSPFGGWQTLPRMLQERSKFLANSVWQILNDYLTKVWNWSSENARILTTRLPTWLFAAMALIFLVWLFFFQYKQHQKKNSNSSKTIKILWRAVIAVSFLYLLVGSFWFQPWYFLWLLAPAALLPKSQFTRLFLPWLVFGTLSSNVIMDFLANIPNIVIPPLTKDILPVIIIWGPALIAVGVNLVMGLHRQQNLSFQE